MVSGMAVVELVLFFGPPFVGKTIYYYKHYSQTHCRIAPSEIFKKDKCTNLRFVILKAVDMLSKGKSVVIDNENWYCETRKSYTCLIKQKVPNCKFSIVQFTPDVSHGYEQCLWSREWVLVQWTMLESDHETRSLKLSVSDEKLDCWFSRKRVTMSTLNPPEFPVSTEGLSLITVDAQFTCNSPYKLNLSGLFVQWESIVQDSRSTDTLNYKPGTPEFLNRWLENNPSGRVIIIGPKLKNDKEIIDKRMKSLLLQLASQLTSPIYFTFIDMKHQPDQYSKLPCPGVLAFLQIFHSIDFTHKNTMYVYHTEDHYKAASYVGIRTIKGEKLLANSQLINAIYCGTTTQSLPFLKKLQELNCGNSDNSRAEENDKGPFIPFVFRARESSTPLVWKYCYGKVNGICFKDKLVLERYQSQYVLAAKCSPLPETTSHSVTKSNTTEVSSNKNFASSALEPDPNTKGPFSLENVNLRQVAETQGRYQAGFICKNKIFDLNTQDLGNRLRISSKCTGSTSMSYNVEAVLSNSSGLVTAHCSCPDTASQTGRCKHVIGLLLNYQDHNTLGTSKKQSIDEDKGGDASSQYSARVCTKTPSSAKRHVNTLYCMSQDELLQTAKELIQKHETSLAHDDTSYVDQGPRKCEEIPEVNPTLPEEPKRPEEREKLDSKDVSPFTDKNIIKRGSGRDDLEELLFGNYKHVQRKKFRAEPSSSFAKETPSEEIAEEKCKQGGDYGVSAMIPDSLVPETISLIPETAQSDIGCSPRETLTARSQSDKKSLVKDNQSFEDFLDELM